MLVPGRDNYEGGIQFLFVARDFEGKGGRTCAEAFREVRTHFPEARLAIVGERPPDAILNLSGVDYQGFLRKSVPAEFKKLDELYSSAFALIHPTSSDIQPLVISEAAFYGCPSIASRSFGIPELIEDGVTGFLIDIPLSAAAFADRMLRLCTDKAKYQTMRRAARAYATKKLTWQAVGTRIVDEMRAAF